MIRPFRLIPLTVLAWFAALAWGQRPSDADSSALLEKSRQKALDYAQSLPDFVCAEVIQRYGAAAWGAKIGPWVFADTLTVKLSYSQRTEAHKLELIDGKPTDRKFEDLGGETSSGEFGGILRTVFNPASQASFDWDGWKKARNRRIAVYQYAVSAARSPYYLRHQKGTGIVGLHGTVEIDSDTGEVWRIVATAYDIPQYLDVQCFSSTVEYALTSVAGGTYLLPDRSENEMHSTETWARSKMGFRNYRKFSADSTIDFGTVK